jgi:hypothetical protein
MADSWPASGSMDRKGEPAELLVHGRTGDRISSTVTHSLEPGDFRERTIPLPFETQPLDILTPGTVSQNFLS